MGNSNLNQMIFGQKSTLFTYAPISLIRNVLTFTYCWQKLFSRYSDNMRRPLLFSHHIFTLAPKRITSVLINVKVCHFSLINFYSYHNLLLTHICVAFLTLKSTQGICIIKHITSEFNLSCLRSFQFITN